MRQHPLAAAVVVGVLSLSLVSQDAQAGSSATSLPADIPASAARFTILLQGNTAGQQALWTTPDGKLHSLFQLNDRGRGPVITTVVALDDQGIPAAESLTGVNYLKSKIQEVFSLKGHEASWTNDAEHGSRSVAAPAFYVALNAAPAELALMAHAARLHGNHLALLPEGEATLQLVKETDVQVGSKTHHLRLFSLTGLDFLPSYVWLDTDDRFVALIADWLTVVPEGWEAVIPALEALQQAAVDARSLELAQRLPHLPPHGVAFVHANLFDAETASVLPDRTVLVVGKRIESVGPSRSVSIPVGAETVDATGKTLLPGLWDMHAHVGDADGLLNLAAGVTTVRDLANDTDALLARRRRIDAGTEVGTRIVLAGIIDGPGPFQGPTKVLVSTEAEARSAVDAYAKLGYVQIKVYSSVQPELVPAIIDEAHHQGLRVSGHIPAGMTAAECVRLGFDEVQHVNFLLLNFMPDVKETRTPARFTAPALRAASLDLQSAPVREFVRLLKERHTTLDPTLAVFEDMFLARPGAPGPGYAAAAHRLPAQVRRGLLSGGLVPPKGQEATYQRSFAKMVELVGVLYRAGIPIEAGTDAMAGFSLQRELELDVQAGIAPEKVLQLATLGAAHIMKLDAELGSVTPGKLADLVLVDGTPTHDISDMRKAVLTVKDGTLYKNAELYTELGVQP